MDLVTIVVMALCAVVSFKGFSDSSFFNQYKFWIGPIQQGEQYRFITSAFLHADIQHLAFNMLTLYFFAPYVVYDLGTTGFITVYIASLLGGNLLSYIFNKADYNYSAIGASGAVMGIVYAGILLEPHLYIYGFVPGYVFAIGYLFYTIYGMKSRNDNIGHDAHFGGAVAGYLVTLGYDYTIVIDQTLTVVLMAIPIVVLFVLRKIGKL